MRTLFVVLSLILCQVAGAQSNQQALTKLSEVRGHVDNALMVTPKGSSAYDYMTRAQFGLTELETLVKRLMEGTAPSPYPYICIIVDGKSGVNIGEGHSQAEAMQIARARCNLCPPKYPILYEGCDKRPTKIRCTVYDGKGNRYMGEGTTKSEALVKPYQQCGFYCAKYPSRNDCISL